MRKLEISKLAPGMVIAENVMTLRNDLLYPEGYRLTSKAITKLQFYSIPFICVEDDNEPSSYVEPKPYSERVQNTFEFQHFAEEFKKDVHKLKNTFNDVVNKNSPLDINLLLEDTLALLNTSSQNVHIFDMINNMRQYDDTTYAHSINVALISNVLASWIGMGEQEVLLATQCGLLHDIGKLTIPSKIIKKPGELTDEEYNIMKTHAYAGYELLSKHNVNPHILNAAMMHHERFDGSGYPFGLKGEKIDVYARIVSIADVYDAMTSRRIYRTALCPFKVIETFEKEGLQKYDAKFILTFMENVLDSYIRCRVRLSDGRNGEVIMINRQQMSRPLIRSGSCYIDLSREPDAVYVEEIL